MNEINDSVGTSGSSEASDASGVGLSELDLKSSWDGLGSMARKVIVGVGGVVFFVALFIIIRACSSGGDSSGSGSLMLVRESSSDLYIVKAGEEAGREHRVVRDASDIKLIAVTKNGDLSYGLLVSVGSRQVMLADTGDGDAMWSVKGDEYEEVLSSVGRLEAVVVDDVLYIRETRDGSRRCYRGVVDDLERVFRGDDCWFAESGHLIGVNRTDGTFAVTVWSPGGDELLTGSYGVIPDLSSNGEFLVVVDESELGVRVLTTSGGGEDVWSLDEGYRAEFASSPSGHLAVASQTAGSGVVLAVIDGDGAAWELAEADGAVEAEFNDDGDLFWIEHGDFSGDDDVLSMWDASSGEARELAVEEGLKLVGVYGDYAVAFTEDDFGICVGRFPSEDDCALHEMDDSTGLRYRGIIDGHLFLIGGNMASLVPLSGGNPVDSEKWDEVEFANLQGGMLFAAGRDGSSWSLFGLDPGLDKPREYGEYNTVPVAAAVGGELFVTTTSGGVATLAYDISTGEQIDEIEYRGYSLIPNLNPPARNRLYKEYL